MSYKDSHNNSVDACDTSIAIPWNNNSKIIITDYYEL